MKIRIFLLFIFIIFTSQMSSAAAPDYDKSTEAGDVMGVVQLCAGSSEGLVVHIPGKSNSARTDSGGHFKLNYVQPGSCQITILQNNTHIYDISGILVSSKQTTDIGQIEVCPDNDGDGYNIAVDCDDTNSDINPGATELCDGLDNNCDGVVDEGCIICTDNDSDGYYAQAGCGTAIDCDDTNSDTYPGATELCGDELDNNCDNVVDEGCMVCTDNDSDGYYAQAGCGTAIDCDDTNSGIHPGATELCDALDNDCDGIYDEDSLCDDDLSCTLEACVFGQCVSTIISNSCLIADACYLDGAVNMTNSCQKCDSLMNQTDWTNLPDGTSCDGGTCSSGLCIP